MNNNIENISVIIENDDQKSNIITLTEPNDDVKNNEVEYEYIEQNNSNANVDESIKEESNDSVIQTSQKNEDDFSPSKNQNIISYYKNQNIKNQNKISFLTTMLSMSVIAIFAIAAIATKKISTSSKKKDLEDNIQKILEEGDQKNCVKPGDVQILGLNPTQVKEALDNDQSLNNDKLISLDTCVLFNPINPIKDIFIENKAYISKDIYEQYQKNKEFILNKIKSNRGNYTPLLSSIMPANILLSINAETMFYKRVDLTLACLLHNETEEIVSKQLIELTIRSIISSMKA